MMLEPEVRRNYDGSIDIAFYTKCAWRIRQEAKIDWVRSMRERILAGLRSLRSGSSSSVTP